MQAHPRRLCHTAWNYLQQRGLGPFSPVTISDSDPNRRENLHLMTWLQRAFPGTPPHEAKTGLRGGPAMSRAAWGAITTSLLCLIFLGCGDVFRPVATPIASP